MKRISFFVATLNKGGLERVSSLLTNYLSEKYNIKIYLFNNDKIEYSINPKVKIISLVKYNKNKLLLMKKVRKILKNDTDIGISMGSNLSLLILISKLFINKPIIISERGNPKHAHRSMLVSMLQRVLFKRASRIVFQTNDVKQMFSKKIQQRGIIIENPLLEGLPSAFRNKEEIVTVGRLTDQKNHELLIRAFKTVISKFPNYRLIIYGEGENRKKLESLISELELNGKIELKGNVDDLHDQIKGSKLFVLPSKYEGLSNALIEAYSMGIPCVGSNVIGIKNIIIHNKTGLLFESNNLEDLIEKILYAIDNPSIMVNLAEKAIEDSKRYNSLSILKIWENLIEEILKSPYN